MSGINVFPQEDFSLGVQAATTPMIKKPNEIQRGFNLKFTEEVGGVWRKDGNQTVGDPFSTVANRPPLGGHIAKYSTGNVRFVAVNNDAGTACIIRTQNTSTGAWTTLPNISYPPNSVIFFLDFLDEVYISGFDPATGDPVQPFNVDKTLDVSSTRNILFCPAGYFFVEYLGLLYIANVKLGATRYTDRVYKGSPPLGAMTFAQGAQTDVPTAVALVDQVPTMTANNLPFGVATASTEANSANQAFMAFDDGTTTDTSGFMNKWTASTTTGWLRYDFGVGNTRAITYYTITGPEDSAPSSLNRAAKTWTFEGSPDGSTWTVLDTQTNVPAWGKLEKRVYSVNNTTGYRYYRINVTANQGATDYIVIVEMELAVSSTGIKSQDLLIDSARYVKPGMTIDIYKAGTDTKEYTVQVQAIDKANNIMSYLPFTRQFQATDVTTASDSIALSVDANQFPTGTPIKFQSNNSLPGGLSANTIYYAIANGGAVTSPTNAGTAVDGGGAFNAWANPSNAKVQDGTYSDVGFPGGGDRSNSLLATNFGFAIPSTATIQGVFVEFYRYGFQAQTSDVQLIKGGVQVGLKIGTDIWPLSGSAAWQGYGAANDLWGQTLTPADINASNFGFSLSASNTHGGGDGHVDGMRISVYYTSGTSIKVATSFSNAQAGNAIDITSQGTGPHYIRMSYVIGDNDELWLSGRKGKLTTFWNVDYPTPEATTEWLAIKPGTDSSNTISAIAKSSNRLFIWTKDSGTRWDGSNLVVFNNSIGCISHRSVANIDDDWIIWMDSKGNIRARNESNSQQENIGRPIRNRFLRKLTLDQMKAASAGISDNTYKLYLGAIPTGASDGSTQNIRVDYDFDANTWSPERLNRPALIAATDNEIGTVKPYFFSDNGKLYIDEVGNLDDGKAISFELGTGPDMLGTQKKKQFYGLLLFSENCNGMKLEVSVDKGQFKTVGKIDGKVCFMKFPEEGDNKLDEGVRIDWQLIDATKGDPQKVEAAFVYWTPREDVPGVGK